MHVSHVVLADKPEVILKRVFGAPRHLVYNIWTEPDYVKQWWGVHGSTIVVCELDVRPGGKFRIDMKAADGTVYSNRGVYLDVVDNERIVSRDERNGNAMPDTLPIGTHTVTFEDTPGGTLVTLISRFDSMQQRDLIVGFGVVDGIGQSLERLSRLLTTLTRKETQ